MRGVVMMAAGALAVAVLGPAMARADITPLNATGWNQDIVVETGAVNDATTHYLNSITASMDAGTAKTGATWYQQGLNAASPATGLPAPLTSTVSSADATVRFMLQSFTGNNALLLNAASPSGTLTLSTPANLSKLAVFASSGNGAALNNSLTIHFADATPDLTGLVYNAADWFNATPVAVNSNGRVTPSSGNFDNVNNNNPRLYQTVIDLEAAMPGISGHPISSITFGWNGDALHTPPTQTAIMAVSGQVVPEPAGLAVLALSGIGLMIRRRKA